MVQRLHTCSGWGGGPPQDWRRLPPPIPLGRGVRVLRGALRVRALSPASGRAQLTVPPSGECVEIAPSGGCRIGVAFLPSYTSLRRGHPWKGLTQSSKAWSRR